MSIVEVSKSVGDLAKAVHEKSKRLDTLIASYNAKLRLVNLYIEKLPPIADFEKRVGDEEFLNYIENPPKAIDGPLTEEYVLIPRRLIKIEQEEVTDKTSNDKDIRRAHEHTSEEKTPAPAPIIANKSKPNVHHEKSKRVCSYCQKTGHSRARCYRRLNGEPPIRNSSKAGNEKAEANVKDQ